MDKITTLHNFEAYLRARCQPGTAKVYTNALKLWFEYLNGKSPSQKTAQEYINHLIDKKLSSSTVNLRGHAIKRWFKSVGNSIELDYPTSIIPREPDYLDTDDIEKLIRSCKTPLEKVLIVMLFDTAVRVSELINLNVRDIDWKRGMISVTRKGGRQELVNVSSKGLTALREWLDNRQINTDRVFGGIEYYDVWRLLRTVGKRAGFKNKLRPHIFRHSRAIHMLMSGATIQDVQQHLGHRSIATTANIYGRFKAVDLRKRIPKW